MSEYEFVGVIMSQHFSIGVQAFREFTVRSASPRVGVVYTRLSYNSD